MDSLLQNLRARLDEAHEKATLITQRCADENRDLNDDEQRNFDGYKDTIEALQPRIEHLVETQRSFDASASALATVNGDGERALLSREAPDYMARTYRNAGAWIVDYLTTVAPNNAPGAPGPEARQAARDRIMRAVANQTVADNPGLVPDTIAGPVVNYLDRRRDTWNSFSQRTITAGPVFQRPRVTQHTLVGAQATEKTELASRKMLIERVPVTVGTYGGVVDVSLQDQYWSNPDIMQVIIDDLRGQYVIQTEALAATALNTAGDANTIATAAGSPIASIVGKIYEAAGLVFGGLGLLPSHAGMSIDVWAKLGSLTDTTGRPIFPSVAPSNAPGTQSATTFANGPIFGLQPVVSGGLPAGTLIIYRADAIEAWEQVIGVLQVTEPRLLGTEVAYAGFAAVLSLHAKSAVSITLTA